MSGWFAMNVLVQALESVALQPGNAVYTRDKLPLCRSEKSAYLDAVIREVIGRHPRPTSGQVRQAIEARLGPDGLKLFPVSTVCERLRGWRVTGSSV